MYKYLQTEGYCAVPALLQKNKPDFSEYTQDQDTLTAIEFIRQEYIKDGEPHTKSKRALKGDHQNWIKAQWVNGVSYDDYSRGKNAAKPRTLDFIERLKNGELISFNEIVNPGGGEVTAEKRIAASIFSVYNTSSQLDQFKRQMNLEDVHEMCELLGVKKDNTLIVLFKRGGFDEESTHIKKTELESTRIKHNSVFNN